MDFSKEIDRLMKALDKACEVMSRSDDCCPEISPCTDCFLYCETLKFNCNVGTKEQWKEWCLSNE